MKNRPPAFGTARADWNDLRFAFGMKLPVATDLDGEDERQGAGGEEDDRLVFAVSAPF